MERKFILFCALVVLSQAATLPKLEKATCAKQCTETRKFGYETGKTYEYDYTSKVSTSIHGASEDKAEIDMTAKVHIEVQSKCDLILKVSDVELKESDPKSPNTRRNADINGEFKRSLEQNSLMFSFQDGPIDELCSSDNEQTWALNIKRAMISAFQNSMDDFNQELKTKETDVTGSCDVNYSVGSNGWYTMTIKKTKDTLGCVDRHGYKTAMQGTPYRVPSEIQSLPLVKSTHECQQEISKAGILQSSTCNEQHVLRPFSREASGSVTYTTQTLKYVNEKQSTPIAVTVGKRTTLVFEHAFDNTNVDNAEKEVIGKLKEMCESSKDSVKVSTASQFTELVKSMKALGADSMEKIHQRVQNNKICSENPKVKKFFLDAIPMVGTRASLKMMTSLINGNEITEPEADMWMTSLAFIKNPTKDMLLELKPLLTNAQNSQAMLAVSSLVYSYCKTSPCDNDPDMINMVSSLEATISVGCYADKNNVNKIIRTLRAFGNAGFSSTVTTINSCLMRKENPTEVRLAAAQAFRRMPCDADRNDLMTTYTNRDEDSELRIAAYLGLMSCPSSSILNQVKNMLESEEVNQVGSFVWSHLTNLMETSSPFKRDIKTILSNDMLKKEFNLEKMKYSRNYEASFFIEKINTGAAIDSNLVWSSKSFLPRSAMTNITIDLFGHSVNLFEIGGRVEGLEYFLESYFGPEGYFGKPKDSVKQVIKGISNEAMDKLKDEYGSTMEELKGSMYMRIFGNELKYFNSDDIKSLISGENFNILDFIINLSKEQDYSFTHSFMFLDTVVVIPTISGFPLNISIDGSATINVQSSGKIDLRQLSSIPRSISINGKIKPSGAVEVSSMMSIDAFVTKAGMKMVSSLNSATALEGHIELKNGHVFSAQWNTPEDKIEIFEARTSFFTVHRDETREQKMVTQNRQTKKLCTGNKISYISGMELCGEISYPNASLKVDAPYFPLTGPVSAGVTLYKRDSHTSYKMEYAFTMSKSALIANVGFNTPGSKVDREMKVGFNLNHKHMDVEMVMLSPWKKAAFNGAINTEKKQMNGKLSIDKTVYSVKASLDSNKKSSSVVYSPALEIVIPNRENIRVDGTVEYLRGTTLDAAFIINGLTKDPVNMGFTMLNKKVIQSVKGSLAMNKKEEYSFETRIQTLETAKSLKYIPFLSIKTPSKILMGFGGNVEIKYNTALNVDLTLDGLTQTPMKYFVNIEDSGNSKQSRYQAKVNIQSPFLTTKGRSSLMMKSTSIITRTTFDYVIPRLARDQITLNTKVIIRNTKKATSVKYDGLVNFKKNTDMNVNLGGDFTTNDKVTKTNVNVQYGANKKDLNKKITLSSVVKHQLAWRGSDVSINAQLQHIESGTDFKVKGSHKHDKKSLDSSITISLGAKHTFSTSVFFKDKSTKLTSISGGASVTLNNEEFSLSNVFTQENNQKYTNDFAAKLGKHRSTVSSVVKVMSDMEYEITNDIQFAKSKPFKVAGQLNMSPRDLRLGAQIGNNYAVAFTSQYKPKTMVKLSSDIKVESRRITADIEAQKNHPDYTGKLEVKWDAERDPSKKIKVEAGGHYSNSMDVKAKFTVENTIQPFAMNYFHKVDKSTQGHLDLSLAGKPQIAIDVNLAENDSVKSGSIAVQTPFTGYRELQLSYDLMSSTKEYRNNIDFTMEKASKFAASVSFDKPLTASKFHVILKAKTPVEGFTSLLAEIDHDSTTKLKSMLKTEWDSQKMQLDVNHQHKPSFIDSTLTVLQNGNVLMSVGVKYNREDGKVSAKQSLTIVDKSLEIITTADYVKYPMSGRVTMKWNKESFDITGTYDLKENNRNVKLDIKSSITKPVVISLGQGKDGELATSFSVQYGKAEVMAVENRFRWDDIKLVKTAVTTPMENMKKLQFLFKMEGGVTAFKAITTIEVEPLLKKMQMSSEWNSIDGLKGNIRLDTPFKQIPYSQVTLSSRPNNKMPSYELSIEYLPKMIINLKTNYHFQNKLSEGSFDLITPFSGMTTMSGSFKHTYINNGCTTLITYTCPKGTLYSADATFQYGIKNEGIINLKWDKKTVHSILVVDMTSGYPNGFLKISTPFSDDITVDVKQKLEDAIVVTSGSVKYNGKEISVENRFRFDDTFVFTTVISTPFTSVKKIHAVLESKGDLKAYSFLSSIEVEPLAKKLLISSALNTFGGIDGNLRVETPFDVLPYSQMTISSQQTGDSTKSVINIEYLPAKFITVKSSHKLQPSNCDARVEIQTPFNSFRHASASIKHTNNENIISSFASIEYPKGQVYNLESSFTNAEKKEVYVRMESPYNKPISISFRHQGKYPTLETHGEVQYQGTKQHILDFTFNNNKGNLKTAISYKYPSADKMSLEINHAGDTKQFTTAAKLQYRNGEPHEIEATLKNLAKMQGSLTVKSPFIDDFKGSFHHTGSWSNLKSSIEYTYGKKKPTSVDVALITGKRIQGSVKLSSPSFDDININLIHKGTSTSFRNTINIIYSKKQKISSDLNFRIAKVTKATLILVTPFKDFKKVVTNIKHEGTWKNFECDANIKNGNDVFAANMKTSIGAKFNWQASIETPFAGWKKMNAAATHEGQLANFKCHAEIARGKDDMFSGDLQFAVNPTVDIVIAAQTPFVGYKTVKALLKHETTDTKIKSHAEITYFKKDTISADFLVNKPTRSAEIAITTPFSGYERMSGSFAHTGSLSNFNTKLNVATDETKKISVEAKFSTVGQISAELKIATPFLTAYPTTDISFSHSGSLNNFRSRANLLFNKKNSFADVSFNTLNGVEGEFILESPYFETVKANILHKNEGKMKSSANIQYGKKNVLEANIIFKNADMTNGAVTIKVINTPKIDASVEYEGSMFNHKANLQVSYGKDAIRMESQLECISDISLKLLVSTPFSSAKTMYVSFLKTGQMKNMNGHFEAGINQHKIAADATYLKDDITKSSFTIRTPFSILTNADLVMTYSGELKNFEGHVKANINGYISESDLSAVTDDRIDIRASLKTPYTKDLVLKFNHDGLSSNFKSSSELSYGTTKVSGQMTADFTNGVQLDAAAQTPFTEDIIFSTSTNNDFGNFRSLSQLTYKGNKQHELELTLSSLKEVTSSKVSAQVTYNGKTISGQLQLDGDLTAFHSKLETRFNSQAIIAEIQFDSSENIKLGFTLKTPFTSDLVVSASHEGYIRAFRSAAKMSYGKHTNDVKMSFHQTGSLRKFSTDAEIIYNGKAISTDITFDATNDIEGKIIVRTPITADIIVHFTNEGTYTNFKTCLKVTYSGSIQHDASLKFDHAGWLMKFNSKGSFIYNGQLSAAEISFDATENLDGKITITTPISKDIIIAFSNEGSVTNFKTCLKITYSGSLQHDASLKFDFAGSLWKFTTKGALTYNDKIVSTDVYFDAVKDLEGKITLSTPIWDDIILHFSNEGELENFKTCLKITHSGSLHHDASLKFDHAGSLIKFNSKGSFTYNGKLSAVEISFDATEDLNGRVTIKTPITQDIIIAFSNEGSVTNFKTCLKITYSGSLQHDASLKFDFAGSLWKFTTKGALTYNDKIVSTDVYFDAVKDLEGKITLSTPVWDDIILHFSHEGEFKNFKSCLKITYSGSVQHDASVSLKYSGSIKKFSGNLNAVYNVKQCQAEVKFNIVSAIGGHLMLKTPWMDDIAVRFSHQGQLLSFTSHMEVEYSGTVRHRCTIVVDCKHNRNGFQSSLEFSCDDKKVSIAISSDTSSGIDGNVILKTTWTNDMAATVKYSGKPTDFKCQVLIDYSGARQHEILVSHNTIGDLKKFSTFASASYNDKSFSMDGSYDSMDKYSAQLKLKSPFTKDAGVKVSFEGTLKRFSSNVDVSYGDNLIHAVSSKYDLTKSNTKYGINTEISYNNKMTTLECMIDFEDDYEIMFAFKSPFTDDIVINSIAQVTLNNMKVSLNINVAGNSLHDSSISVVRKTGDNQQSLVLNGNYNSRVVKTEMYIVTYNGIDAKVNIETPIPGIEQISGNLLYAIDGNKVTVNVNGKIGSSLTDLSVMLNKQSPYSVMVSLKTPYQGLTDLAINLNFNNNPTNFRLNSDLSVESSSVYELTLEHIYSPNIIQGNLVLKTSMMEDIEVKYDVSGSLTKSSSSVTASIGNSNYISLTTITSIQERQPAEFRSTFSANIAGITKTAELALTFNRKLNDFNSKLSGKLDSDEIILTTSYKSYPSYEVVLNLQTPFQNVKSISAVLKHVGRDNYISTSAAVSLTPGKSYEININAMNKNFKKIDIKAEVKLPWKGHELMRWVYKHEVEKNFMLFSDYTCSNGVQAIGDIKISPRSFDIDLKTPFQNIRTMSVKGKLENQNLKYNLATSFLLNDKSVKFDGLVDLQSNPMTARIQLRTPFTGFEVSEISMSCTGDISDLRATFALTTPFMMPINSEIQLRYKTLTHMEGTAILKTGIKNFENLRVSFVNQKQGNEYQTHFETTWNKDATITVDASFDKSEISNGKQMKYSFSVTTPFRTLKTMTVNLGNIYSTGSNLQSVLLEYNGNRLLDIDASYTNMEQNTVSLVTRHPRPMNFRISGRQENFKTNADISLNWNTEKSDSNVAMELYYSHKDNKCHGGLRFVHPLKTVGFKGELERSHQRDLVSFDVTVDDKNLFGYDYDCKHSSDDKVTSMKVRLPSRSVMVASEVQNRLNSKMVVGSFYWDADRDQTKKISIKGDVTPIDGGFDANLVLEMPSIGQDVKIDSTVQFNKGSVVFDGKTEFKYTADPTKTLLLSSRLEDLSSGTDTNYSFSIGIKHPYTTVDVEMTSRMVKSDRLQMASVDVNYQTAERIKKNFLLMGEIDSLKQQMKVQIKSPIKSINIQGHVQTNAPYKLSINNMYDNTKPINAEIVIDPSDVSLDVNMNYDIENPQNILHVNAKLSDESGVTAEIFRNTESQRISDTLLNLRLKTSRILHTRVQWNPDLLKTVKMAGMNKIRKYGDGINNALQTSWMAAEKELQSKYRLIVLAMSEDMKPYMNFLSARINELKQMRRNNEFYLNDVVVHFETTQNIIRNQMNQIQNHIDSLTKDISMETYNLYLSQASLLIKTVEEISMDYYAEIIDLIQTQSSQLSNTIQQVYAKYGKPVSDSIQSLSSNSIVEAVRLRLPTVPVQQLADKYNTVMYNARESINIGLIQTLPTPVYHLASSAYKYWEIEENIRSAFQTFVNFLKKDIEDQFRNIKELITDVQKTKVTAYDPIKGLFEMDIYLPLEMKSLTEVKEIVNPLENLKSLIPQSNPLPSWNDVWSHAVLPSFGAHAYIKGDHFTTFDGQEFDFSGRCSYVLARDFAKDKFSIILNYMGRQNKKLIVTTTTQNVQISPNGKVRIDGTDTQLPYSSDEVLVSQTGNNIYIDGTGFSIINNIKDGSFDIEISHWFHGRTGGLLGVHDNERYNDMMTSDRQITSDPNMLANTWQVQDKCR